MTPRSAQKPITKAKTRTSAWTRLALAAVTVASVAGLAACGGGDEETAPDSTTAGSSETTTTSTIDASSGSIPQPTEAMLAAASLDKLPVAPDSDRIDIAAPTFSNPTEITNPRFPISELRSVVFSGRVDGLPFHTETTLLPETRLIEWSPGEVVETRVSQYFAYIDGRIEEVAQDYYAQADDGSVWYLGEDVYDYDEGGQVDGNGGTWLAGREGPAAMIMPGDPQVGDVHRAENSPGVAFEEVEVKRIDKTVEGPAGPVKDVLVARELHDDGTYSDKVFAPGYGEFFSGHDGDVEALALAVPTDALDGPTPSELDDLSTAALDLFGAAEQADAKAAGTATQAAERAWRAYSRGQVPPRLRSEMDRAFRAVSAARKAGDDTALASAAIDVAQSALDLELRYRDPAEVDVERFELWASQLTVDAAAGDLGAVRGDVATLEWIRDRFVSILAPAQVSKLDSHLVVLRDTIANGNTDLKAAGAEAGELQRPLALDPVPLLD